MIEGILQDRNKQCWEASGQEKEEKNKINAQELHSCGLR